MMQMSWNKAKPMNGRTTRMVQIALGLVAAAVLGGTLAPQAAAGDHPAPVLMQLARNDHPLGELDEGPHRYRHGRRPLSEEQLDEALTLLEKLHPELAEKLKARQAKQSELDPEDRDHVGAIIQRHFPRLRHLLQLKDTDPAMYELRVEDVRLTLQSRRLAQQYSEALRQEDEQRAEQRFDELQALLEAHFEIRQRLRQLELQRLEQRIAALREQIEAREDDRDEVIEQRLHELVGTEEGARW